MNDILFALLFFWPAGNANSSPIFANKIPILRNFNKPVDFGKSWRGKRIFGDHKTWRGFIVGTLVGGLTAVLQMGFYEWFSWFRTASLPIDYSNPNVIILGMVMGFGALAGDSLKSFFKRQLSVSPGRSWFPFDQIDNIVGGCLASLYFIILPWQNYVIIALVWFVIHPAATLIGWLLRLKDSPI